MVKLLFCLELFNYSMFDSVCHIVDSIDIVARTIAVVHSTSIACGPNKEGPVGQLPVAEAFCLALHHPATVFTITLCLTWTSSIEVLIKAPCAGYHAAVLRLGASFFINQHKPLGPIPLISCLPVLSHPRPTTLGVTWRPTTRSYTNEKKRKWREEKRSWVSCLQVRKSSYLATK